MHVFLGAVSLTGVPNLMSFVFGIDIWIGVSVRTGPTRSPQVTTHALWIEELGEYWHKRLALLTSSLQLA